MEPDGNPHAGCEEVEMWLRLQLDRKRADADCWEANYTHAAADIERYAELVADLRRSIGTAYYAMPGGRNCDKARRTLSDALNRSTTALMRLEADQ